MQIANKLIMFMLVTTVIYLIVRNARGAAQVIDATASGAAKVQKTAQGR